MTLAVVCVSFGLQGIPVMVMACQGHGPSTKPGLFVAELKHNWSHLRLRLTSQALGPVTQPKLKVHVSVCSR